MKNNPLISIIITTKNREDLLKRAISSVINQTYSNLEIIIINDASEDNTKEILEEFEKLDSRIKVIHNKKTLGSNPSRNIAIDIAKGKFIAGLDDDDEFMPNRIEVLLKNYDEKYAFVTSWNIVIKKGGIKSFRQPKEEIELNDVLVDNLLMNQGLIEKQRIINANMYDEKLVSCQDYDMWLRLILKYGKVKVVQEYLQLIHEDDNITRISTLSKIKFSGYLKFYKKYKYLMNLTQKKDWLFRFYDLRKKKLSKKTLLTLTNNYNAQELLTYYINNNAIEYKYSTLINFYDFIDSIDLSKKYILYGYGSLGKLIFPFLKNNLLAIIDKNLDILEINNIKIIKIDDLSLYKNITIIVSPIIHLPEIINNIKPYGNPILPIDI
jgi:glycosyltransferase involved in cell wall biosynthesis